MARWKSGEFRIGYGNASRIVGYAGTECASPPMLKILQAGDEVRAGIRDEIRLPEKVPFSGEQRYPAIFRSLWTDEFVVMVLKEDAGGGLRFARKNV